MLYCTGLLRAFYFFSFIPGGGSVVVVVEEWRENAVPLSLSECAVSGKGRQAVELITYVWERAALPAISRGVIAAGACSTSIPAIYSQDSALDV